MHTARHPPRPTSPSEASSESCTSAESRKQQRRLGTGSKRGPKRLATIGNDQLSLRKPKAEPRKQFRRLSTESIGLCELAGVVSRARNNNVVHRNMRDLHAGVYDNTQRNKPRGIFGALLPSRLLRLLPAGTRVAGRDSHPLENRAFARRTI